MLFATFKVFIRLDLKKVFVCRHSTLGLLVGQSIRIFLYLGEGQSHSQCLTIFDISFVAEKESTLTIVIIDSDKALVNLCKEGMRFK